MIAAWSFARGGLEYILRRISSWISSNSRMGCQGNGGVPITLMVGLDDPKVFFNLNDSMIPHDRNSGVNSKKIFM